MWLPTHSMTKLRKKSPLGKETTTQMEKGHNRLRGNSSLQNSISESKYWDPHIKEIKRKSQSKLLLAGESKPRPLAHRTVSKTRQSDRKIHLEKNFLGPLTQMPHLDKISKCPAERERERETQLVPCASRAEEEGLYPTETPRSLSTSINIMTETGMILFMLP